MDIGPQFSRRRTFLLTFAFIAVGLLETDAQTNSWTSSTSGNWQDSSWSLGAPPGPGESVFLTNAGWKAVQIMSSTAQNYPQTLNVASVTVSSPFNAFNVLLMNFAGLNSPLQTGSLTIGSNAETLLLSSALDATNAISVGGEFDQGDFSTVTASNLQITGEGPGIYNLTNGSLTVTANAEIDGGTFAQYGGNFTAGIFNVGGTYLLEGGLFSGPMSITNGAVDQSGGTNFSDNITLGVTPGYPDVSENDGVEPNGDYTVSGGVLNAPYMTVNYPCTLNVLGGSASIGFIEGTRLYDIYDGELAGYMTVQGGTLVSGGIDSFGPFTQTGGTNAVTGSLIIDGWGPSYYVLSAGLLMASDTIVLGANAWAFRQSGGLHIVTNFLQVNGLGGEFGPAYALSGGVLVASNISLTNATFAHTAGGITNSGLIIFKGSSWSEETSGVQLGQLRLNGASNDSSSLALPGNQCVAQFADSSSQSWTANTMFYIANWKGSLQGGGLEQVVFGHSSSALTAQQLSQIIFTFSEGTYGAQILSTGEVVPSPVGLPFPPSSLGATSVSSNRIDLVWLDNSLNETGFAIERSVDGTNFIQVGNVNADITNYSDTTVSGNVTYYYRVYASGAAGNSSYSNVAVARTKYPGASPLPGMVAWWQAEHTTDDSIGPHDAYPMGASVIVYAQGEVGRAFDFSGTALTVPDSPDFFFTNGFTAEAWIYPRALGQGVVCMRGDESGRTAWMIDTTNIGALGFQIDDASNDSTSIETSIQTNQWQHFAATFDGQGDMRLYLNGALAAQTSITFKPAKTLDPTLVPQVAIGAVITGGLGGFDGRIDELALYSRALSPVEVKQIYNAGVAGKSALYPTLTIAPQPGGAVQLTLTGPAPHSYEFQVSSDLQNWFQWTNLFNSNGTITAYDSAATKASVRFYRAVSSP